MLPPMPEVAAYIFRAYLEKTPRLDEETVAKRARGFILTPRGAKGKFLTETPTYWFARIQGGGGIGGNSVLPVGHTTMDKSRSWREGFSTEGTPVIVPERDYPQLEVKEIANLFAAQAVLLWRTETRGSNIGPDTSSLLQVVEPQTTVNMIEPDGDLLRRSTLMREAYANSVLPSIHYSVPGSMAVQFDRALGRMEGLHTPGFGPGTQVTGLALTLPDPNEKTNLICLLVEAIGSVSRQTLMRGTQALCRRIEDQIKNSTLACIKGKDALIYMTAGDAGSLSYNDAFDHLALIGRLTGTKAANSLVDYKDITFSDLGVKVSKESFTRRVNDVMLLPLSLDISPRPPKVSQSKPYEGAHEVGMGLGNSGYAILPVFNPDMFDPGHDDHPQIVHYRMNEWVPAVVDFLRTAGVAPRAESIPDETAPLPVWDRMRNENAVVKEAAVEDLEFAVDGFAVPHGREVTLTWDEGRVVMCVSRDQAFVNTPQTLDFEAFCIAAEVPEGVTAKAILTPTDRRDYSQVDALYSGQIYDTAALLARLIPLEVQVYGIVGMEGIGKFRSLAMPHAKVCRNISTQDASSSFAEVVNDELDTGLCSRLLLRFPDREERNIFSEQVLNAAIIGFDTQGKNPQNGMVGKVVLGLLKRDRVRIGGGPMQTTEMYLPIGVTSNFAGFSVQQKRSLYELLIESATHPGYEDGFIMVDPESTKLLVRVMHKGIQSMKKQDAFRLKVRQVPFRGKSNEFARSPLDRELPDLDDGRKDFGTPTEKKMLTYEAKAGGGMIPIGQQLEFVDQRELPTLRAPTITGFVNQVDGFEDMFIEDGDKLDSRFRKEAKRLTFQIPSSQLIRNGPEPSFDEADIPEGTIDEMTLLTLTLNPPTENWSAHRQRVPWDFDQNAFGKGSAFRTMELDDPEDRRKTVHMEGWNRRYDGFKGVQAIVGKLASTGKWAVQSIRVPRKEGLRRTMKEARLDARRPPSWYRKAHPGTKPFGTKNPVLPRNAIAAMDEGWTGFPTWAIQPTFSISDLQGNPPWAEDEDEEPPTPEEYSVPNEKGVVAQHIETQDEAESIVLRWTNKTGEDFVPFEMIYTMPDGSRRWAVVRKPEGGKSGSPLVSPMRSAPHYLESANKYGLGPDCPRCGSNYTEKVGKIRVAVQDGPAHVMEGGYHCNYCGFDWDTESIDLVRLNPPKTPGGKTIPKRYLKGLTEVEKAIAMYEIDRGYEFDTDDPEAYEFWKSDIMAKARGLETMPSKYRVDFAKRYGPLPEGKDLVDRLAKATGIGKRFIQKAYDKGLAAWRVGHRPGVTQHQWASGRAYAFVMGAESSTGPGKPDHKLAVEAGVRA